MEYQEHAHGNPLFSKPLTAYVGQGQTQPSTCSDKPKRTSPPNAKIRDAIAKLGLRYRPTSATDLEAHAGQLALLAVDLSDMPADLLNRAVEDWAVRSPFMPKAFDLIKLAQSYLPKPGPAKEGPTDWEMTARERNDRMAADPEARRDVRWVAGPSGVSLQFDPSYVSPFDRFIDLLDSNRATVADVDAAPLQYRKIAEERGYLRRLDDGAFIIRQRRSAMIAGL